MNMNDHRSTASQVADIADTTDRAIKASEACEREERDSYGTAWFFGDGSVLVFAINNRPENQWTIDRWE